MVKKSFLTKNKSLGRQCSICYFGKTDETDLGTNQYWCSDDLKLNSIKCKKKFKLLAIFRDFHK